MTFWLAKVGIDTATIGFAVALTLPYTLKFLWAPLVDKLPLPFLTKTFGQRRSWLFFVQTFLFLAIWQLGASDPSPGHLGAIRDLGLHCRLPLGDAGYCYRRLSYRDIGRRRVRPRHRDQPVRLSYGQFDCGCGHHLLRLERRSGPGLGNGYGLTAFCIIPAIIGAFIIGPGKFVDRYAEAAGMTPGNG
jgi:PAT family beta-lactamase induction signal transducer AmpG